MRNLLIAILIVTLNLIGKTNAACKAHDAAWKSGISLRVTQPARSEPDKVVLDWNSAIKNSRCVDFYNVYVWKHGQPRNRGQKIVISDKTVTKADLTIEPCVEHHFAVELIERDWTHTDEEMSPEAKFKTEAIPQFINQDKKNFVVTYYTDPIKQYQVVDKVSIKFRKNLIKHASCIKHVEIKGIVDDTPPNPIGGSSQTGGRSFGFGQRAVGGSNSFGGSGNIGGSSQYNPGHGNTGGSSQYNPGQNNIGGSSQYNPGQNNIGGSSQYNPGQNNPGGSSHYNPGQNNIGGSSQYNPETGNIGGSSRYNPGQNIDDWSQHMLPDNYGNPNRNPNCPVGGSSQSNRGNYDPSCYWSQQGNEHNHVHGDYHSNSRPPYDNSNNGLNWNNQRRVKRSVAGRTVQLKLNPPYIGEFIEAVIPVKPCTAYKFEMKIVTPSNAVLGKIEDLRLPHLTEMYDFHPAPLSKIIQVSGTGSLSLKPTSGIPAQCIKDYFVAVDNHVSFLKDDLQFHMNAENQAHQNTRAWSQNLDYHKRQQLTADGCHCNSTFVNINGTSKSSYQNYMGLYHFEAMHQGKPYYTKQDHRPMNPNGNNPNQQPQRAFFFWDPTQTMWKIGPTLGVANDDAKFRTKEFSNQKCPADAGNLKNFQYSGTLKWKSEPTLNVECVNY